MALTHHVIAKACGGKLRAILGDDIVLSGVKPAQRYQEVMKKLGVKINSIKSIVFNPKFPKISQAEIAKRLFVNGKEVTPIPMKLLLQAIRHPSLMVGLFS